MQVFALSVEKKSHDMKKQKKKQEKLILKMLPKVIVERVIRTEQLLLRLSRVQPCISPPLMVFTTYLGNAGFQSSFFVTKAQNILFLSQP